MIVTQNKMSRVTSCFRNTYPSHLTGEVIVIKRGTVTPDDNTAGDVDDIVKRLTCTSDGCEVKSNVKCLIKCLIECMIECT